MINNRYRIISNGLKFKIQQRCGFWLIRFWMDVQRPKSDNDLTSGGPVFYNSFKEAEQDLLKLIKHDDAEKWKPVPIAMYSKELINDGK